eukprot:gene18526-20385_t
MAKLAAMAILAVACLGLMGKGIEVRAAEDSLLKEDGIQEDDVREIVSSEKNEDVVPEEDELKNDAKSDDEEDKSDGQYTEEDEEMNKYMINEDEMIAAMRRDQENDEKDATRNQIENDEEKHPRNEELLSSYFVDTNEADAMRDADLKEKIAQRAKHNELESRTKDGSDEDADSEENQTEKESKKEEAWAYPEEGDEETAIKMKQEKKSPGWFSRRRSSRRRSSRRRGTGCHYKPFKFQCSAGCCFKGFRCRNCRMKFYIKCFKYLYPPVRGSQMGTARWPTTDQSNWMARFQNKKLYQITLPGSHHTGININPGKHLMDKWDIPQTMSIANQLKAGIRFFDVRVATGPFLRQPSITHNYKYQEFEKLIKKTVNFLKYHRNELVVIRLKEGRKKTNYYGFKFSWKTDWTKVDKVLNNWRYASYVYRGSSNALASKVSSLRGKIIICQEGTGKSSLKRLRCDGSWSTTNTNSPTKLYSKMTSWTNARPTYSLSRFYFLEAICTMTGTDIQNSIWLISKCKRSGNKALYKYKSIKDLATECNYQVYQWISSHSISKLNAIMTDFVNPKTINLIISKNR